MKPSPRTPNTPYRWRRYYLLRLLERIGLAPYVNLWHTIDYEGSRIRMPVIRGLGAEEFFEAGNAVDELWMQPILDVCARTRPGAVLDIGANVGQCLMKTKAASPSASWIGFEPNPYCAYYLHELIKANGWRDCRVVCAALGDSSALVPLLSADGQRTDVSASVVPDFLVGDRVQAIHDVAVVRLDDEVASGTFRLPPISIIKIDVEGAELAVARGMKNVIHGCRAPILLEVLRVGSPPRADLLRRQDELETFFGSLAYRWFRVLKDLERNRRLERLAPIDKIETHDNRHWCQYLLIPSEADLQAWRSLF